MTYTYLLDLYEVIDARIADIDDALEDSQHLTSSQQQHLAGRRDCLDSIHRFLGEHYDHKLPRRLQGRSSQAR